MVSSIRLDRALTLGVMAPMARLGGSHPRARLPILMYHAIRNGTGERPGYYETSTSPQVFAAHMEYLAAEGYRTVGLEALNEPVDAAQAARRVVLTFDDGCEDFYTAAAPILSRWGFHAVVFVVSSFAQHPEKGWRGQRYLDWAQVRAVQALGHQIGSHTETHCNLHTATPEKLANEIDASKRAIEDATGRRVDDFAFPYAFPEQDRRFVAAVRELLCESGYRHGVCTAIGTAMPGMDPLLLPRLPVNRYDDRKLFEAKLHGAYDWLRIPQFLTKALSGGVASRPPLG